MLRGYELENKYTIAFDILLTLILWTRDIGYISINKFVILAFCTAAFLCAKPKALLCMMSFLFPLFWGIPGNYIMLVWLGCYIVKSQFLNKKVIVLSVLFGSLEVVNSFFYPITNYIDIVGYLLTVVILFIFLYSNENEINKNIIIHFFAGVVVLCGIISIATFKTAPSNWIYLFINGWFRFGEAAAEIGSDVRLTCNANTLAYYSIVGMAIGCVLYKNVEMGWKRVIVISGIIICTISGIFTVSRSWMLMVVILIIMLLCNSLKSFKGIIMFVVGVIIVSIALIFLLHNNSYILEGFTTRFQDNTLQTGGGRTNIFVNNFNAFFDNFRFMLMGSGVTQYQSIVGQGSIHNATLQIFVCLGIPCGFVYILSLFLPLKGMRKRNILYWIPFICAALFLQTIQVLNPWALMLPLAIGIIILKYGAQVYAL